MDEQQPRGGLKGGALLQVGRQGVEQRGSAAEQRLVHVADQGRPGVIVAVQGTFGQQFVRAGGPGRVRPGGGGVQRGQGGPGGD